MKRRDWRILVSSFEIRVMRICSFREVHNSKINLGLVSIEHRRLQFKILMKRIDPRYPSLFVLSSENVRFTGVQFRFYVNSVLSSFRNLSVSTGA